ncbi:MAG: hypothetical protein AAGF04_05040 [Chlamydiota bacterium]
MSQKEKEKEFAQTKNASKPQKSGDIPTRKKREHPLKHERANPPKNRIEERKAQERGALRRFCMQRQ